MEKTNLRYGQLESRYRARGAALNRIFRPPLPVFHNSKETGLPQAQGLSLWIGGAGQVLPGGFLNVDLLEIHGVDVVADVEALPFANNSVARIECDAVLEHVRNPATAVAEMYRVLRPGGFLHVVVPFCHPVHLYPADYRRWTLDGLRELLGRFTEVSSGVRTGPTATLLTFILEYLKIISPRFMKKAVYGAAGWVLWPFRYLDAILMSRSEALVLANHIYLLSRKP